MMEGGDSVEMRDVRAYNQDEEQETIAQKLTWARNMELCVEETAEEFGKAPLIAKRVRDYIDFEDGTDARIMESSNNNSNNNLKKNKWNQTRSDDDDANANMDVAPMESCSPPAWLIVDGALEAQSLSLVSSSPSVAAVRESNFEQEQAFCRDCGDVLDENMLAECRCIECCLQVLNGREIEPYRQDQETEE